MIKFFKHTLKSGALQLTVFIIAVIAILLGAVLTLTYVHRFFIEQSRSSVKVIKNANEGFQHILQHQVQNNDTVSLPFDEKEEAYIIRIHQSNWGIFEKAWVETSHRTKKFHKIGLIGSSFRNENIPALYLKETYKPLVVVGNTEIRGTCFLPKQGVKTGYISGQSYYGNQLIYGLTKKSNDQLPAINKFLKTYMNQLLLSDLQNTNGNYLYRENQIIENSFFNETQQYNSRQKIILENCSLIGNIIVKSDSLIKIKKSAILKDIIVIAPYVEIETGFTGNLQVFSTKSIILEENCNLLYPSALILLDSQEKPKLIRPKENQIFIDTGSVVSGSVCYFSASTETNFRTQIVFQPETKLNGEVYCEGNIELMGWINGTLYTHQLISNKAGSIFVNHLFNGKITSNEIYQGFAGTLFENDLELNKKKSIVKWLY